MKWKLVGRRSDVPGPVQWLGALTVDALPQVKSVVE
jgi:hypothetical protein